MRKPIKKKADIWRFTIEDGDYNTLLKGTSNSLRQLIPQIGNYLIGMQNRNAGSHYRINIISYNDISPKEKLGKKYIV